MIEPMLAKAHEMSFGMMMATRMKPKGAKANLAASCLRTRSISCSWSSKIDSEPRCIFCRSERIAGISNADVRDVMKATHNNAVAASEKLTYEPRLYWVAMPNKAVPEYAHNMSERSSSDARRNSRLETMTKENVIGINTSRGSDHDSIDIDWVLMSFDSSSPAISGASIVTVHGTTSSELHQFNAFDLICHSS